ncbi:MAG: hypothetical protein HOC74_29920, partial [Gemmatimonadetes bacterium]|nr:hypothetical protein [Gemmatimonadota bacterium]
MVEDPKFRGVLLPEEPTLEQVREIVPDYTAMLLRVMTALADRADRHPDYPFVDTKLDLITGEDFPEKDPIRGRDTIYGWIQGRALEALAGHCIWIHRQGLGAGLLARLQILMRRTLFQLRQMRRRNNGRLSFFMTPEGAPFRLGTDGQKEFFELDPDVCGTSDLFCAKGMLAAARLLGDLETTDEARAYCHQVDDAIWQDRYASDQQPLDPKNPVTPVPGRHPHGQFMIQIGTAALMAAMEADRTSIPLGLRLIRHELRHHANLEKRLPELEEFDFWESIDDEGRPYRDGEGIVCDPGHALEFVGLALKFTSLIRHLGLASDQQLTEIDTIEAAMPPLLLHTFDLGFQPGPGGIIKAYDLVQRQPLNTDMPWWNLPETMRAAIFCWRISAD